MAVWGNRLVSFGDQQPNPFFWLAMGFLLEIGQHGALFSYVGSLIWNFQCLIGLFLPSWAFFKKLLLALLKIRHYRTKLPGNDCLKARMPSVTFYLSIV